MAQRRTYYFRCPCLHRWWDYLEAATPAPACPACGSLLAVEEFGAPALVGTSRAFVEVHGRRLHDDPFAREHFTRMAADAGVSTNGKVYLTELARYAGDEECWVPEHDAPAAAKALCERRGWGCENFKLPPRNPAPPERVGLADDIVQDMMREAIEADPGLPVRKSLETIEGDIRDKHTPHWAKKDAATKPPSTRSRKKKEQILVP